MWLCVAIGFWVSAAVVVAVAHFQPVSWPVLGLGYGLVAVAYVAYGNAAKAYCRRPIL